MNQRKYIPIDTRRRVYKKTDGRCAYCGYDITLSAMHIDHVIPYEFAEILKVIGKDVNSEENLFPSCRSCNNYKHTLTIEKMRKAIEAWPRVLYQGSATYRNAIRYGLIIQIPPKVVFCFEEIGLKAPDWLDNPHTATAAKYTSCPE